MTTMMPRPELPNSPDLGVENGSRWCVMVCVNPKPWVSFCVCNYKKWGVASKETHQHHLQSSSVKINEARQGWQKVDLARRLLGMNLDDSSCSFLQISAFWTGKSPTGFAQDALSRNVEPLCGVSRARRGVSHFRVLLSTIGGAPCTVLTV